MLPKEKLKILSKNNQCPTKTLFRACNYIKDVHSYISSGSQEQEFNIYGRIITKRHMGKITFCNIKDKTGEIQILYSTKSIGETQYNLLQTCLDVYDLIGVRGKVLITSSGVNTLKATQLFIIGKNQIPIGRTINNTQSIYRQRYLDLIVNPLSFNKFISRSKIIKNIRHFLDELGFIEVETPMMHSVASGAIAKPFKTHYSSLNQDMYLRIAPELYLKQLIVGGMDKVYEINRNFRNEGISSTHSPEFTMLECYQVNADYTDAIKIAIDILKHISEQINKDRIFTFKDHKIDLNKYTIMTMEESVKHYFPSMQNLEGEELLKIFEEHVEQLLIQPTIITDYPSSCSPLAKTKNDNPLIAERFEMFIAGMEIANGYSELTDPDIQQKNMEAQGIIDTNYINCLKYGMPRTGGLGIGIDRVIMLLHDIHNIRDVILFPTLKNKDTI